MSFPTRTPGLQPASDVTTAGLRRRRLPIGSVQCGNATGAARYRRGTCTHNHRGSGTTQPSPVRQPRPQRRQGSQNLGARSAPARSVVR